MFTSLKNKLSVIFFSNLVRYLLVRIWKDSFGKNLNTQIIALSKNVREFSPLTSLLKGTAIFGIHIFFLKTLINVYIIFFSKEMRGIPPPGQFPRSFPPHGEFPSRSIPWIRDSPRGKLTGGSSLGGNLMRENWPGGFFGREFS